MKKIVILVACLSFIAFASYGQLPRWWSRYYFDFDSWPDFDPDNYTAQVLLATNVDNLDFSGLWGDGSFVDISTVPDGMLYVCDLNPYSSSDEFIQLWNQAPLPDNWSADYQHAVVRYANVGPNGGVGDWGYQVSGNVVSNGVPYVSFYVRHPMSNAPAIFYNSRAPVFTPPSSPPVDLQSALGSFGGGFASMVYAILPQFVLVAVSIVLAFAVLLAIRRLFRSSRRVK